VLFKHKKKEKQRSLKYFYLFSLSFVIVVDYATMIDRIIDQVVDELALEGENGI
jgi:hypothetical protein